MDLENFYWIELKDNLDKYYLVEYYDKIKQDVIEGLPDENLTDIDIYDYLCKITAQYVSHDPNFSKISSWYQIKIYDKTIGKDYNELLEKQYGYKLISDKFYNYVKNNYDTINELIDWDRDLLIDYFGLKTLERSYLLKDTNKNFIERPQLMWIRTAIQIHGISYDNNNDNNEILRLIKETYDYMSQLYFTHATPTLFNAGTRMPQMSSCFLMQCPDDLNSIADSFKNIMLISAGGGGIGINISDIRCSNSIIRSTNGRSNGIIPLCQVLENLGRYINQSGRRQGSIACFIEPWHADIIQFIELRKNTGDHELRARDLFLGLWIPDLFIKKVKSNSDWYLMNPDECKGLTDTYGEEFEQLYEKYVLEKKYVKVINAKNLYETIMNIQFETGMPYFMFKDTINKRSNQKNIGIIKNSNLCSEIVEFSSKDEIAVCNLASISLPKFIDDETCIFDFNKFGDVVRIIVRNLNKIIDCNYYPVIETEVSNKKHRPIGIGVQGLADCYYKLGFGFDHPDAYKLNKQIFECLYWYALDESSNLARIDKPYETFYGSPFSQGQLQFTLAGYIVEDIRNEELNLDWYGLIEKIKLYGTKNSLLTTTMPTASTAQILNNNESIEPYASNMYVRKVLAGEYIVVNKYLINDLKKINKWNNNTLTEIQYDNGSVQNLDISIELKNKYKTAYELKQSVIVKQAIDRGLFIDQSQSMNLFIKNPDKKILSTAHIYAWEHGLKTGSYYIRTQPTTEASKFSIDIDKINEIKTSGRLG